MTNLITEAGDINAPPCECKTPRAEILLRRYSLQEVPAGLLENLKNAERGFHMRRQESDLAVLLYGMAEDHQDACEDALLMAMISAKSQGKGLDADEMAATEDFGRVKKAKGVKGAGEENNKYDKTGLGEEKNGGDSQVKGLDTGSSKGKNGEGKTGTTRMVVKENNWGAVFMLLIIACFLYKIFF